MPRMYTVPFVKVEESEIVDWFEITPAANKMIEVVGLFIGQSSDFGDAQAEIIPFKISRGWTNSGSGGSAPTPTPVDPGDAAASFTAETMNTVVANTGTEIICHSDTINVMPGEKLWLPDGCGAKCTSTQTRLTVRPTTKPTDPITLSGTLYVREF
jgi:hypothetical protein